MFRHGDHRRLGTTLPLLLFTGALLLVLADSARAQREGAASGKAPPEAPDSGDGGNEVSRDGGNEVSSDGKGGGDEGDGGGGDQDEPTARTQAPPKIEAVTIPLETAALENGETSTKEEPDEPSTEPVTPTIMPSPPTGRVPVYRLKNRDGETCILMEMDAVVGVFYETMSKEMRDLEEYVDEVQPTGTCGEDEAQLTIAWKAFKLRWRFSKTPGGERWYVNLVELNYAKSDSLFENASSVGDVTLTTRRAHGASLFFTPVGRSYHCLSDYKLELSPPSGHGSDSATLLLRQFRVQPFMFKPNFAPAFECSPGGGPRYRDETAPIAVGSTLAVVVLLTVTGYGVYRYFKIKKVQYDTME